VGEHESRQGRHPSYDTNSFRDGTILNVPYVPTLALRRSNSRTSFQLSRREALAVNLADRGPVLGLHGDDLEIHVKLAADYVSAGAKNTSTANSSLMS
jgi:5-keto 4-deoxyuronate isomerase